MTQTQLQTISTELSPLATEAIHLIIVDQPTLTSAVSLLSQLNQYNDRITQEKEKVTAPLNQALKAERARWKPMEVQYQEAIDHLRSSMSEYQTKLVKDRQTNEQAIANRIGEGRGKLRLETAVARLEALPEIDKTTSTDNGTVTFRETPTLVIDDLGLIPLVFFTLDESALLKALKSGKEVKGAHIEIIQSVINHR